MLEEEKMKCKNHLSLLNNRRDDYMKAEYMLRITSIIQLREEISYLENGFRTLRPNSGIRELPYNEDSGMYPMSSVYSMRALTYSEGSIFQY